MSLATRAAERAERIATALEAARLRECTRPRLIGEAELYCETSTCPAREVVVHFKELDGLLTPRLRCPACRQPLKLHHVQTLDEAERERNRCARRRVNVQRYIAAERARSRDARAPVAIPLGVLLDETLSGLAG